MPSDERTGRVLEALTDRVASYRAALKAARDEMQEYLAEHRARGRGQSDAAASALGPFASGRIDTERFGAMLTDARALAADATARIVQCVAVIDELLEGGHESFVRQVGGGDPMRRTVESALADLGRAFGAVRVFRAVKAGSYLPARHGSLLVRFPFALWSRAERDLAPPLVIEIEGAELRAEHVMEYLDGEARMVFVVSGQASPAPLVALITPATLVIQTDDIAPLHRLADAEGPAVAAVLPTQCARFVHDPRGGSRLDERLTISALPKEAPRLALGFRSSRQMSEELAQLAALAELTAAAREVSVVVMPPLPEGGPHLDGSRAVDAVASWMLAQAGFAGGAQ